MRRGPATRLAAGAAAALVATVPARGQDPAGEAAELWARGERHAAVAAWADALARRPGDEALRARLIEAELAIHHYEAALAHCAPLGEAAARFRGPAHYFLGEYEQAVAWLRPDDAERAFMLVDALAALGRLEQADAALARALERARDDPRLLAFEGERLTRTGDDAGALAAYEAALARDPLNPTALYGRGRALIRLGRREEGLAALAHHRELLPALDAHEAARRALDLDPSHGPNHAQFGDVERALGRHEEARRAYARAAELATPDQLAPITLRRARLLHEDLRRSDEAVARLDEAFARVPDVRLLVRAADVLVESGRPDEALVRLERARAIRPTDAAIAERIEHAAALAAAAGGTGDGGR